MSSQVPALLIANPLVAAMVAPIIAYRSLRLVRVLSFVILALTLALSCAALMETLTLGAVHYKFGGWLPPWGIEYVVDPLNATMAVLISFFALLTLAGLGNEVEGWAATQAGSFHALYLLLVAGLLGICVTGDLFNLYVFLEISALASYALVSAGGDRGKVAAYRYLIVGSVAASFYVLGVGYLYAVTGTLNIADMAQRLPLVTDTRGMVAGVAFIVAGMGIKMALFPLHGWQPDAYTYAPASVIPFISAVMAKVAAYVLLRVLYTLFAAQGAAVQALEVLGWVAALSMVAGSLLAAAQTDVRRMLAYSSVGQLGYIALGFAIGNTLAITGAILHIINHAVMKGCLFFTVAGIRARTGKTDVKDFAGLGERMPWTAAGFTLVAISMIGLPPTCGFFSKLYLVTGAIQADAWPFVAALAVSSLLSVIYFFRVIEQFYLRKSPAKAAGGESPPEFLVPVLILATLVLLLGLFNQSVVDAVVRFAVPVGGLSFQVPPGGGP